MSVVSGLLAPILGPPIVAALLGASIPIEPGALALRLAALIGSGAAEAGAVGVVMGDRNIALYVGAPPPDPAFAVFVGMYQHPMYLTPLAMRRLLGASAVAR